MRINLSSFACAFTVLFLLDPSFALFYPCPDNTTSSSATDQKQYSLLEGTVRFEVSNATAAPSANVSVAAEKLRESIDEDVCNVNVRSILYGSEITISFFLHMTPLPTKDYNQEFDTTQLMTTFSDAATISDIFTNLQGPGASIVALRATANINECHSKKDNCSANADCFDQTVGFSCMCKPGYQGDGYNCVEIQCDLAKAPKPAANGGTVVRDAFGDVLDQTSGMVSFGTTVVFTCDDYYTPTAYGSSSYAEVTGSICGGNPRYHNTSWSGTDIQCSISFEFRIAIACSIVSGILIVLISACFIASCCDKIKKPKQEDRMILPLDEVFTPDYVRQR